QTDFNNMKQDQCGALDADVAGIDGDLADVKTDDDALASDEVEFSSARDDVTAGIDDVRDALAEAHTAALAAAAVSKSPVDDHAADDAMSKAQRQITTTTALQQRTHTKAA